MRHYHSILDFRLPLALRKGSLKHKKCRHSRAGGNGGDLTISRFILGFAKISACKTQNPPRLQQGGFIYAKLLFFSTKCAR